MERTANEPNGSIDLMGGAKLHAFVKYDDPPPVIATQDGPDLHESDCWFHRNIRGEVSCEQYLLIL